MAIRQHARDLHLHSIAPDVLRIAVYADFYPVAYTTTTASRRAPRLAGLDVDIMRAFCRATGLKARFIRMDSFDDVWKLPESFNKHFDIAIGGIGRATFRDAHGVEWSMPYFKVRRTVIYNLKDPIKKFPEDVTGKVAGTMGSTGMTDAAERMWNVKKSHLLAWREGTDEQDLRDLLSGKLQGLMRGSFVGKAIVARYPKRLGMVEPWKALPHIVGEGGEVFAFPCRRGSGLAGTLNAFLGSMTAKGELAALVKKHGMD